MNTPNTLTLNTELVLDVAGIEAAMSQVDEPQPVHQELARQSTEDWDTAELDADRSPIEEADPEASATDEPSSVRLTAEQEADYERWVRAESGKLLSSLSRRFGYGRAEDLLQVGLARAYRKWDKFEDGTNRGAWLHTVVIRAALSEVGRDARQPKQVEMPDGEDHDRMLGSLPDNGLRPDDVADMQEISGAINGLSEEFKRVVLDVTEGYSYEEIAERQGIPIGTVQSRISRARKQVRASLDGSDRNVGNTSRPNHESDTRGNGPSISDQVRDYALKRADALRNENPGITARDLSEALGISYRQLRRYEEAADKAAAGVR
jgi:RNA polymerase sigma-70 factor, ECF subfamily